MKNIKKIIIIINTTVRHFIVFFFHDQKKKNIYQFTFTVGGVVLTLPQCRNTIPVFIIFHWYVSTLQEYYNIYYTFITVRNKKILL